MTNDHKPKSKKSSGKFETTTLLKLPESDLEEEVTINEPGKTPKKKKSSTADEETVKMTTKALKEESSVEHMLEAKARAKNKQKDESKPATRKPQTVYISKSKESFYSNVLLEVPDRKPLSRTLVTLVVVLILVSLLALVLMTRKSPDKTAAKDPSKPVAPQTLKLSAIKIKSADDSPINIKSLQPGNEFTVEFSILDWTMSEAAKFVADVRIYDNTGRMLYYKPNFAAFEESAIPKTDKVELATKIQLGPDVPAGFYKVMIYVTEPQTGLTAERQTRIKVVPKV